MAERNYELVDKNLYCTRSTHALACAEVQYKEWLNKPNILVDVNRYRYFKYKK